MAVTLYLSTDASAPTLSGTVGSLVSLLDACLVNGYGSKSAAGWTIAYTATNKRDYKQGTGSNGYYLDVDDSGPGAGAAREARLRGYETMSALATGTLPFPTTAQSSTFGVVCRKSTTADSTARPWYLIADATCFYLFVDTGDVAAYSMGVHFGDFFSYSSGDTHNTILIGRNAENTSSLANEAMSALSPPAYPCSGTLGGHWIDRSYTAVGGSVAAAKHTHVLGYGNVYGGAGMPSVMGNASAVALYPNGPDNSLEMAPVYLGHNGHVRGYLKGFWCPMSYQPLGHGDTFAGTGNMAGKSFIALNEQGCVAATVGGSSTGNPASNTSGQIIIETSNTWS